MAPHPHIGLQTVTWLFEGGLVHRDSLGSEQLIRVGELNLMGAGAGVAHSEENPGLRSGSLHGVQLWIAQDDEARWSSGTFEHHRELPALSLSNAVVTVLLGAYGDVVSPASAMDLAGYELRLSGGVTTLELRARFEHALVVTSGVASIDDVELTPGQLAYLAPGRQELKITAAEPAVALLVGGEPLLEELTLWWNFVARSQDEISHAYESWMKRDGRFGDVDSRLARVEVGPPPWHHRRT